MQTPHSGRPIRRFALGLVAAAGFAGVLPGFPAVAPADPGDPVIISGSITWVSDEAVEVDGQRGLLEPTSDVRSDGRAISRSSIHTGMPAEMELDPAGQILELTVQGVTE